MCWTPIPSSTPRPSCRCWSGPAAALKPSKRVLIVSDDGTRPLPSGKDCKSKKVSEAEKSFRAVILDVD